MAVTLRGYPRGVSDPRRAAAIVARVHQLWAVHARSCSGIPIPGGADVALARFAALQPALSAAFALRDEVETARSPDGHDHGPLLSFGVSAGTVLENEEGQCLGDPCARALRLAVIGEHKGEILLDRSLAREVPVGIGAFPLKGAMTLGLDVARVERFD